MSVWSKSRKKNEVNEPVKMSIYNLLKLKHIVYDLEIGVKLTDHFDASQLRKASDIIRTVIEAATYQREIPLHYYELTDNGFLKEINITEGV